MTNVVLELWWDGEPGGTASGICDCGEKFAGKDKEDVLKKHYRHMLEVDHHD